MVGGSFAKGRRGREDTARLNVAASKEPSDPPERIRSARPFRPRKASHGWRSASW